MVYVKSNQGVNWRIGVRSDGVLKITIQCWYRFHHSTENLFRGEFDYSKGTIEILAHYEDEREQIYSIRLKLAWKVLPQTGKP